MGVERRVDSDDGAAYTWEEFSVYYAGKYKKKAIESYWDECKVISARGAKTKAKAKVKAKAKPTLKKESKPFERHSNGFFGSVEEAPADPVLKIPGLFKANPNPNKINLGVGAYRTAEGKPYVLPVVLKAEEALLADTKAGKVDKEYSTIDGPPRLAEVTQALIFGDGSAAVKEGRIASCQALSGTGALRIVGEFAKKHFRPSQHVVYISDPTWINHKTIFEKCGLRVQTYPYWHEQTMGLDFEGMQNVFKKAPKGSMVLLHAVAHNPTGVDPTEDQWKQIADVMKERQLVPIMDNAYQGYASGSLDKDAFSCRLFESMGLEMFLCQSFAKNLGCYGERIGMVHVVCQDKERATCVLSQLKLVVRPMYSSPPIHGAHLVMRILGEPPLLAQWKEELQVMADRVKSMRAKTRKGLEDKGTPPGNWQHVTDQIGMFSYTGIPVEACERLVEKHAVYILKSGRISLAGLNDANVDYFVQSVDESINATASSKA